MYERLGDAKLKSGERMELGVVTSPDPEWRERIVPFLGHKTEPYASHIQRSNDGPLDQLETRYYVGHLDGRVITEVMVVGARGAGVLGHVYTLPEERRKGAYQSLMAVQMADVRDRGFRVLTLGTGYDSPAYWIYHRYGFRGLGPGRGEMKWSATDDAEAGLLEPGRATVRDVRWDDWGFFALLGLLPVIPDEELPRSRVMRLRGQGLLEAPFVHLMLLRENEKCLTVRVLQSEHGATVGWAILAPAAQPAIRNAVQPGPDPHWLPDAWTLELHAHPAFARFLPDLLHELPWPDAPVVASFTEPAGPKAAAVASIGFTRTACLPSWFRVEGESRRDMGLWTRT